MFVHHQEVEFSSKFTEDREFQELEASHTVQETTTGSRFQLMDVRDMLLTQAHSSHAHQEALEDHHTLEDHQAAQEDALTPPRFVIH